MRAIARLHVVYPLPVQLAAHFLGCGMFSLFYGGTWRDGICGGICGVVIGLCSALMARFGANLFFKTIAGAAASAVAAVLLTAAGLGAHRDLIIIGIMAGDMVAGISKGAEALLIGAAIALGTALGLGVTGLIGGGGAL